MKSKDILPGLYEVIDQDTYYSPKRRLQGTVHGPAGRPGYFEVTIGWGDPITMRSSSIVRPWKEVQDEREATSRAAKETKVRLADLLDIDPSRINIWDNRKVVISMAPDEWFEKVICYIEETNK